ncbi:sperm surface protein Sp17-like isoform X2 [Acanthaster planci]|uniref:Sperm surface protein Sp17-like isoform X2 n=1 Tax=Acanthaster planci TaxID=133434 RepID=A0A8B7Y1D0_ACAPL|nr:sperm surface protein Sp17-like isoform X2 [Acanthaster planci]
MSMRYGPVELSVPPGFQNILHLISQEVLREKPTKTLEFIAGFLDDLLAIREDSGYDPVTHGEMMERVQERYWKIVKMRRNSQLSDGEKQERVEECNPEVLGGSGDVGEPAPVSENVEVLVTVAMQQDDGGGAVEQCQPSDEEMDQTHLVAKQEQSAAEQQETATEEQEDTIQKEGEQSKDPTIEEEKSDENSEQDEVEDTPEQAAMATEEAEKPQEEAWDVADKDADA